MGLLLVNRAIHAEAADIFWSLNTFTFRHFLDFDEAFATCPVREEYRRAIRSVKIADGYEYPTRVFERESNHSPFWQHTLSLPELTSLALPSYWLDVSNQEISELKSYFPNLGTLSTYEIMSFTVDFPKGGRHMLRVKVTQLMKLEELIDAYSCKEAWRKFEIIEDRVKHYAMTHLIEAKGRVTEPRRRLDDRHRRFTITIMDGTEVCLELFGVPLSKKTLRYSELERQRLEDDRKSRPFRQSEIVQRREAREAKEREAEEERNRIAAEEARERLKVDRKKRREQERVEKRRIEAKKQEVLKLKRQLAAEKEAQRIRGAKKAGFAKRYDI